MDEAQIARAQEWTFSARQVGPEGTLALFRVLPVALCNAGTGYPDLTYAVGRKLCQRLGIGDDHFLSLQYRPKTDQRARTLRPGGRFDRFVVCKRRTVKRLVRRSVEAAADKEGRLGEAVAGEKGFAPEAHDAKAAVNCSRVSARTGSAPLAAATQLLRSSISFCSGVILRTQRS